ELGVAVALTAMLFVYQYVMIGHSVYYFENLVHSLIVVTLVGLGSAARLLPRVHLTGAGAPRRLVLRRLAPGLAGAAAAALFLAGLGGRWHDQLLGSHGVR